MRVAGRELTIDWRTSVVAGTIAAFGTVVLALFSPGIGRLMASSSDAVVFGTLLLLSSGLRVLAGVFATRSQRRRSALLTRTDAIAAVVVGAIVGALAYSLLIAALGAGIPLWRTLLEIVRWGFEAALGAFLVAPGTADDGLPLRGQGRRR